MLRSWQHKRKIRAFSFEANSESLTAAAFEAFQRKQKKELLWGETCKRWHEIISSPCFRRRHTVSYHQYITGTRTCPSIILQDHESATSISKSKAVPPVFTSINPSDDPYLAPVIVPDPFFSFIHGYSTADQKGFIRILHSCNGLVLLLHYYYYYYDSADNAAFGDVFVCNPCTAEHVKIQSPPGVSEVVKSFGMNLVFDPSQSLDYKVVSVFEIEPPPTEDQQQSFSSSYCSITVYSSVTGSWGDSTMWSFSPNVSAMTQGVLMNGILYWPPYPDGADLFLFNVEPHETVDMILLPRPSSPPCKYRSWQCMVESRDCLYIFEERLTGDPRRGYEYMVYKIDPNNLVIDRCSFQDPAAGTYHTSVLEDPPIFLAFTPLWIHNEVERDLLFFGANSSVDYASIFDLPGQPQDTYTFHPYSHAPEYKVMLNGVWDVFPYTNTMFPLR